jgi:microcystin-dependent protein
MDAYMGSIMLWPIGWAPQNWMFCDGSVLQIQQYSALYSLLGTTFGGNGTTTFALPDLRNAFPMGYAANGPSPALGAKGGAASVALQVANLPAHTHQITPPVSNAAGTSNSPVSGFPAIDDTVVTVTNPSGGRATAVTKSYATAAVSGQTAGAYQSGSAGGGTPVAIEPPYLALGYIICVYGIYPSRP